MKRFNNLYGRPVIPFYRTTLYELVQVRVLPSLPPYLPTTMINPSGKHMLKDLTGVITGACQLQHPSVVRKKQDLDAP